LRTEIPNVLLDACVVLPPQQRNLLLQMASDELFAVFWTDRIIGEWLRNVGIEDDRAKCENRTVPLMRREFPNATLPLVTDDPIGTTDLNDVHVARAALAVSPCILLTWNVRDFDLSALAELDVEVITPDVFLTRLLDADPALVEDATRRAMANLTRSAPTWSSYLEALERNGLTTFAERLHRLGRDDGADLVTDIRPSGR